MKISRLVSPILTLGLILTASHTLSRAAESSSFTQRIMPIRTVPAYAEVRGGQMLHSDDSAPNTPLPTKNSPPATAKPPAALLKLKLQPGIYSSLEPARHTMEEILPIGTLNFDGADVPTLLATYEKLSGRNVIGPNPVRQEQITFHQETPLTRREALQVLDSLLAQNNLTVVYRGAKTVKVVTPPQAAVEAGPICDLPPDELPDSDTYILYYVEVKNARAGDIAKALQPFSKVPNSILAIDSANLLVLRDYSANVRRMLRMVQMLDKPKSAEH